MIKILKSISNWYNGRTNHQSRVRDFMLKGGQAAPNSPTIPKLEIRSLRARLVIEEALELIEAMNIAIHVKIEVNDALDRTRLRFNMLDFRVLDPFPFDFADKVLSNVAKEAADLSVVTTGTLLAYGIKDTELLEIVDNSNIAKFGPGWYRDEYGKIIKPTDWKKPDIASILDKQKVVN